MTDSQRKDGAPANIKAVCQECRAEYVTGAESVASCPSCQSTLGPRTVIPCPAASLDGAREEFEKAHPALNLNRVPHRYAHIHTYNDGETENRWLGWQASRASDREREQIHITFRQILLKRAETAESRVEQIQRELAEALMAMEAFRVTRGSHEGPHKPASWTSCVHCDDAYLKAELELDKAEAALRSHIEGQQGDFASELRSTSIAPTEVPPTRKDSPFSRRLK